MSDQNLSGSVGRSLLVEVLLSLLDEGYVDPREGGAWFSDGEKGTGFLGTLEGLSAADASVPLAGDPGGTSALSAASHAGHLLFSLDVTIAYLEGNRDPSDWSQSWVRRSVDEDGWRALRDALSAKVSRMKTLIASRSMLDDAEGLSSIIGTLCHGAWHLGALRQGLGLIVAPGRP